MKSNINFLSYLAHFFLEREMFEAKVVGKIKTRIFFLVSNFLFFENRTIYDIMWEKCCRGGQATDDNMTYARCMLDT
jgi:hypothetical protein